MAYVAGDALITIRGTIASSEEWANTWAVFQDSGPYDPQDVTTAFHDLYDALATASPHLFGPLVDTLDVRFHNLFTGQDEVVSWAPIPGTGSGNQLPAECALRVSLRSLTRRGGPFLPPATVSALDTDGQLLNSYQTTIAAYIEGCFTDVAATGAKIGLHSPTDTTVYEVVGAKLGETFDVIRRRRNEMPESYVAIAVQGHGLIYSTRFAERNGGATSGALLYTVPSGYVAVIRDVDIVNGSNLDTVVHLFRDGSNTPYVISYDFLVNTLHEAYQWRGRWVLNAGDQLLVDQSPTGSTVYVTVNGYLLPV